MRTVLLSIILGLTTQTYAQTNGDDYFYVEVIDQKWDTTHHNGSLKINNISIPSCQLEEAEIKFDASITTILEGEIERQISSLKLTYAEEGISQNIKAKFTDQTFYRFGEATLGMFEHTVDFENTKIVTVLIIDAEERFLYSRSNKLGLNMKIICIKKTKDKYVVFGESDSNPEFSCGGIFKLIFDGEKRIVKYSYCEENN